MNNEKQYWIAWSGCSGIGPVRFDHLLKFFGSAESAWKASNSALQKAGAKGKWLDNFLHYRHNFNWYSFSRVLAEWGIVAITKEDQEYPSNLKEINKAPIVLYVMEQKAKKQKDKNLETNLLAVVGTRKITSYGRQITQQFVHNLVDAGLDIISGLMYGVDEIAHRSCIEAGGYTVGVWAGGLDTLFCGSRKNLAETILNSGGTLISEFPIGFQPSAQTFPYRNRIVSGMSCGVLVIEGSNRSGTLITAGYGAEQGKEVFAVPGSIISPQSVAPLKLIKAGAKPVTSVEDILEEINITNYKSKIKTKSFGTNHAISSSDNISVEEQKIIDLLQNEPHSLDELSRNLNLSASQLGSTLSLMELKNWIKQTGEKWEIE